MDQFKKSTSQLHLIRVTIKIQKVKLSVRFPCTLSFEIKADDKIVSGRGNYQLQKGECMPAQTLRIDVEVEKNNENYLNKAVNLIVFMSSTTGKIPAGSLSINPIKQQFGLPKQYTEKIQKCPDKNASLNFQLVTQFQRCLPQTDNSLFLKLDDGQNRRNRVNSYTRLPKYPFEGSSIGKSRVNSKTQKTPRNDGLFERPYSKVGSDRSLEEHSNDLRRVVQLERQKSEYVKQISRLKNQLYASQNTELYNLDEHLLKYKDEIDELSLELEGAKQKIRFLQRKQKDLISQNRQLKDEVERKQEKNDLNQYVKLQNQSILDQKQKQIRFLQAQIKTYEQQLSDMKISLNTQQKRITFKQNSFKEQLDKMNEKYQQSQKQRQNSILELNKLLEQMQKTEKKNQIALKEKERGFFEEKNKLGKKNQQFQRKIDEIKEEVDLKDNSISDLNRQIKGLHKKLSEKDEQIGNLKNQLEVSHNICKKQQSIQKGYEKQIIDLKGTEKSYHTLKKKNLQTSQDLERFKQKSEKTSFANTQLNTKIKNLQGIVLDKNNEINGLNNKITNLVSQFENLKKEDEQRQREAETLSISNLNAAQRIEELRSKIDISEMKFNELENQFEEEIGYLIKSKEHLQGELDDYKWNYEKSKENCEEINSKVKLTNEEILILNKKLLEAEERYKKQEEVSRQLQSQAQTLSNEKQVMENKEKQYQQYLKNKNNEIYQLNKKIHSIEKDYFMLEEKNKHAEKFYTEKLGGQELLVKQKDNIIIEKGEQINKLQIELLQHSQNIHKLQKDKIILLQQIDYLKESSEGLKQQNKNHKTKLQFYSNLSEQLKLDLQQANSKTNDQLNSSSLLQKNFHDFKKQFQQYKDNTFSAMQQLIEEISKDEDNLKFTLMSFPDQRLSGLQVEAIKKRNTIIQKYRENINELKNNINTLEYEIAKSKKYNEEQEQQFELQVQREKQKLKGFLSQTSMEKQQHFEKIRTLEDKVHDLTTQLEHLNIEISEDKSLVCELQQIIQQNNINEQNLKSEIKTLQNSMRIQNDQFVRAKQEYENEMVNLHEQKVAHMEKAKKNVNDAERKSLSLEKANLEMEENVRKLQNNLTQAVYQRDRNEQKLLQLNNKYLDSIKDHKNALQTEKHHQKQIKELLNDISMLQTQKMHKDKKIQQISILKKKLEQGLAEEQVTKNKLKNQLEVMGEQVKEYQLRLQDVGDKGKKANEKYLKEIKELKQNIIGLNSEMDLKTFMVEQQEASINKLKESLNEESQQLSFKKKDILEVQSQVEKVKNENILLKQELQNTTSEKNSFESEIRNLKDINENMNEELNANQATSDTINLKERQIQKLKQELEKSGKYSEKAISEMKNTITEMKKELTNRTVREEDLKKKIRELQKIIEEKQYDLQAQRKNWEQNSDLERAKLSSQLSNLKQDYHHLQEELEFQRKQLNQQLNTSAQEGNRVSDLLSQSEKVITEQHEAIQKYKEEITLLKEELKKCEEDWKAEKLAYVPTQRDLKVLQNELNRYQKYYSEVTVKNKQLIQLLRRKAYEETQSGITELLREISTVIMRSKTKIIQRAESQKDKEQIMNDFKLINDKIQSGLKSRQSYK